MRQPFSESPLLDRFAGRLLENFAQDFARLRFSKRPGARIVRGLLDPHTEFHRVVAVSLFGGFFEPATTRVPIAANPKWRPVALDYEHSATISETFNSVQ